LFDKLNISFSWKQKAEQKLLQSQILYGMPQKLLDTSSKGRNEYCHERQDYDLQVYQFCYNFFS
jgi:hypothetical protein